MHCRHTSRLDPTRPLAAHSPSSPLPLSRAMRGRQLERSESFPAGRRFHLGAADAAAGEQQVQPVFPDCVQDDEANGEANGEDEAAGAVQLSKTNSERGRAFRARQRQYEDTLVTEVNALRRTVTELGLLCSVRADTALRRRNSVDGSLVRLANEYFALFERGMPSVHRVGQKRSALSTAGGGEGGHVDDALSRESFARKQQAFLESAMDPDLQFGGASGLDVLLDQWQKYTSYHSRIYVEVVSVQVVGAEDSPIVTVRSKLHVVLSRATFDRIFPHVADNEDLVRKFIGREVVYHGVNHFQFSPQGQISIYDSDVGFVDAFVHAGASVSDIVLLMQHARIADECRLKDEDEMSSRDDTSDCATDVDSKDDAVPGTKIEGDTSDAEDASPSDRFAIDFILS
ncbi:unnamed protein product [Hyaloperonospora brassicae]|uniref:BZIP domain-containing protein n=1 Tax=Hyaloperonospora brassicae TaxID=162125 RepID=A0AAV0TTR2_HYABA|nr:unnamed protein product [Hyaloperonospora brassicae]